jgi:hypothetical protein
VRNLMLGHQYCGKNTRSCEVVFQRQGYDVESIFWAGPMEEVRELAERIALRGGAETYRIVDLSGSGLGRRNYRLRAAASDA